MVRILSRGWSDNAGWLVRSGWTSDNRSFISRARNAKPRKEDGRTGHSCDPHTPARDTLLPVPVPLLPPMISSSSSTTHYTAPTDPEPAFGLLSSSRLVLHVVLHLRARPSTWPGIADRISLQLPRPTLRTTSTPMAPARSRRSSS